MSEKFDFNEALAALQSGQDLTGKDGILTPLIKQLTEAALKAELESHLEGEERPNRKNGSSKKTLKAPPEALSWRHRETLQALLSRNSPGSTRPT